MKLSVVIIVKKDTDILMYNRGNVLNEEWTVLGGHMNYGESIFECAKREAFEEANIEIDNLVFLTVLEDQNSGYISFYVLADYKSGNLIGNINEKIENLRWMTLENLPKQLYPPFKIFANGGNIHGKSIYEFLCK